jgi:iron complex outermembrane receptor protein
MQTRVPFDRIGVLILTLVLLAHVKQAAAQDQVQERGGDQPPQSVPEVEAPSLPPQNIESIEITGERELTSVQDQANAITRFDMGELDKLNITNVDGLASNVPGLHVGQQGQAAIITLRGVGTENASLTGESGVAFHVDGVYFGRPAAARVAFYDIEMIDVKRGPQGLLGGKNSTSGTIEVTTRNPELGEYAAEGDYLIGNYDRQRVRGMVNVPMGEFAAARLALFWEDRDGYLEAVHTPTRNPFSEPLKLYDAGASRDFFDSDNFGLRGKIRFTPAESFDLVVGYHWFREDGNGPQADLVPLTSQLDHNPCVLSGETLPPAHISPDFRSTMPASLACASVFRSRPRNAPKNFVTAIHTPAVEDRDPRKTFLNDPSFTGQKDRYWGFTTHAQYDVPELPALGQTQLKAILGYERTETQFNQDFDASSLLFFPLSSASKVHEHSAQLEWSGDLVDRLEWQASLFFTREQGDAPTQNPSFGSNTTPGEGPPTSAGSTFLETQQEVLNKSYGAALHGAYQLTDAVTFSLGGRWIKDRKRSFLRRKESVTEVEACRPRGGNEAWGLNEEIPWCDATFRGTMWGSRLEFRPTDDHTLYAGIDRGYKSGGFGLGGVGGYLPEKIWAYSIGTKSVFFDQRLQLNVEGFFYNYQDMQIALIDGTETRTENSDARMYGWEIETRAMPIDGLNLRGVLNYIHTETIDYYSLDPATLGDYYQDNRLRIRHDAEEIGRPFTDPYWTCADPSQGVGGTRECRFIGTSGRFDGLDDFSGKELSRSPRWKYTISGDYEIPIGRFGTVIPHVQYTWQDDTYFRVFNRDFDLQEAFHKTDAKLMWESPEQRWTAEVFVENIEDDAIKDFILIGSRVFSSPPLAWYSAPRFYGFRVGFKY